MHLHFPAGRAEQLRRSTLIAAIVCLCATGVSAQHSLTAAPDTVWLSLDSCISVALSDNPLIRVASLEIDRSDYTRRETIGKLFPSISFDGQYGRTLAKQTMYMNMGAFGGGGGSSTENPDESGSPSSRASSGGNTGIKVGLDNSYSIGFSASLPVIAPQLWKTVNLTELQILENVEKARQSKLSTVNQVKSAYYSLLLALESYEAIRQSYDMAQYTASRYVAQFQLGTASEFDTLRSAVAVRNIEPQLVQATIAIRQARLQLGVLMGLDPTRVAVSPNVTLADYAAVAMDDLSGLSNDIEHNTDLRILGVQQRELQASHTINKMAWFPTVALSANYNWTTMSNGSPFASSQWNPYSSIGLSLSLPLFQGGQRYYKIKQSAVQIAELDLQRENLERTLRTQTDLAIENIRLNQEQIATCDKGVEQAEAAYRIQYNSFYGVGASSYLDLRDSELALTQARLLRLQAIYNYLVARGDLEYLLGTAPLSRYGVSDDQNR